MKYAGKGGCSSVDGCGGQHATDSVEVGTTEEISALRTDQLAVVLPQICRTVGTNLRGLQRTPGRGFYRKVGAGQEMWVFTGAVRHVYTAIMEQDFTMRRNSLRRQKTRAEMLDQRQNAQERNDGRGPNPLLVHVPSSEEEREFCAIRRSSVYNAKRSIRFVEPRTRATETLDQLWKSARGRTQTSKQLCLLTS